MPTKSKKVVEAVELAEVPTAKPKSRKRTAVKSAPVTRIPRIEQGTGKTIINTALQDEFALFMDGLSEAEFNGAVKALNWAFCGGLNKAARDTSAATWGHKQFILYWQQAYRMVGAVTPKL